MANNVGVDIRKKDVGIRSECSCLRIIGVCNSGAEPSGTAAIKHMHHDWYLISHFMLTKF
jgi:hypothetical protein